MLTLHSQSQQFQQLKVGLKGPTLNKKQKMNKTEIKDFKQFLITYNKEKDKRKWIQNFQKHQKQNGKNC